MGRKKVQKHVELGLAVKKKTSSTAVMGRKKVQKHVDLVLQ